MTIVAILKFIKQQDSELKLNNLIIKKIVTHYLKSHFLIILFCSLSFFLMNLYSLVFYYNFIGKLKKNDQKNIFLFFKNLKFLKQNIIFEIFHALLLLHNEIDEKPKKILLNRENSKFNNYVENIVIGSGPGGSITAYNLRKNNKETLIIEKGSFIDVFKYKHPGNEFIYKWKFGGLSGSLGHQVKYAAAECFGGGSEINSGLYHKPDQNFIKRIKKKFNINEFDYVKLKKNEEKIKKISNTGYLKSNFDPITKILIKNSIINNFSYEFLPRLLRIRKNKIVKKSTMTNTILKKYLLIKGKVSLNSEVIDIKKDKNNWLIRVKKLNKIYFYRCKYLFICAGAPNTLQLLIKNKLIKKKVSSYHLHFHPMIKVIAKFKKKINSKTYDICPVQINHFFPKFIIGVATSSKAQLKINSLNNKFVYNDVRKNWDKMAIFHATFSLGSGELKNLPFTNHPVIKYKFKDRDLKKIKFGLKKLLEFLFLSGCDYALPITANSKKLKYTNSKYINEINNFNELNLSTVHILGGCPMGENKDITVADSYGKVRGQNNLFVNDSSLICDKLIKNPQGIIMPIALRNIENFIKNNKNNLIN